MTFESFRSVMLHRFGSRLRSSPRASCGSDLARAADLLSDVLREAEFKSARALLVGTVSETLLVLARRHRDRKPQNVKSVTKSVMSLLIGSAIHRDILRDESVRLAEIDGLELPEDFPLAREIRIVDLLTMRSGIVWDEWARRYRDPGRLFRARDSCRHMLTKGFFAAPGTVFRYSSGDSQLLAGALAAVAREPLQDYAQRALFEPLGIRSPRWLGGRDGVRFGGAHLFLAPRDLLRIGQLCLAGGIWDGERLVAEGWLGRGARIHAGREWWEGPYGYHWWIRDRGYAAYGYGGQAMLVAPAEGIVCLFTAAPNRSTHIPIALIEERLFHPLLDVLGSQKAA